MELRPRAPSTMLRQARQGASFFHIALGGAVFLAFIFSMFMFLDKRSCVNQTASFCRAGFWGLV